MNHEIAKKWTAALRSGEYKQVFREMGVKVAFGSVIRNPDGCRCALGVLREVLLAEDPELANRINESACVTLSLAEVKAAGMSHTEDDVDTPRNSWNPRRNDVGFFKQKSPEEPEILSVICMNDREMLPFVQIADVIDQHWEKL
jgi:hypothetical protein